MKRSFPLYFQLYIVELEEKPRLGYYVFSFEFFHRPVQLSEVDGAYGKLFRYSSPEPGQMLQSFIHIPSYYIASLQLESFTSLPLTCEKWAVSPRPYSVQAKLS